MDLSVKWTDDDDGDDVILSDRSAILAKDNGTVLSLGRNQDGDDWSSNLKHRDLSQVMSDEYERGVSNWSCIVSCHVLAKNTQGGHN